MRALPCRGWLFPLLLSCALTGCRTATPSSASASIARKESWPKVSLKTGSAPEQATRRQLERLLSQYDLSPWLFTRELEITERAIPHSHPVLTLSTRHVRDDLLLLATYIHEQSHWYFAERRAQTDAAIADFEVLFPGLPVGYPDGADSKRSTYLHLGVIAFEYQGLKDVVGELAADQVMQFWASDHYRALYRVVLDHEAQVWSILRKHGLTSPTPSH